ncbi:hypothetical protein ABPG74_012760 [Tetrahymena malaccensis]
MIQTKQPYFEVLSAKSDQDSEFFINGNSLRNSLYADQTNLTVNQKLSLSLSRISSSHNLSFNICDNTFSIIQDINDLKEKDKSMSLNINLESVVLKDSEIQHLADKLKDYSDHVVCSTINLNNTQIADQGLKQICQSLKEFKNLTKLHISLQSNNITDEGLCCLWKAINNLCNLKDLEIDLSYNEISGSLYSNCFGIETYTKILKCCFTSSPCDSNEILFSPDLVRLSINLESNQITSKGIKNIIQSIKACKGLIDLHLNLRKNNLDCFSLLELSEALGQNQLNILHLDIGSNKIAFQDASNILYYLSKNAFLHTLSLDLQGCVKKDCKPSGKTLDQEQQSYFKSLDQVDLRLGWNNLNAENFSQLTNKFKFNDKVAKIQIDLTCNNLPDKSVFQLMENISACKKLRYLNLNLKKNQINDKGLIKIGEVVTSLKKLKTLSLNCEFSNLTTTALDSFNLDIQLCINIKELSLNLLQSNLSDQKYEKTAKKMQRCHNSIELRVAFNTKIEMPKTNQFKNSLSRVNSPAKFIIQNETRA